MPRTTLLSFLGSIEKRADAYYRQFANVNQDWDELPSGPGVYVLLAQGGTVWPYPWGRSPVFYIGKSGDLRNRLWDHWNGAKQAKAYDGDSMFYAVNHYAAEFSTRFITIPTWQGMTADSLEKEAIGRFVRSYGARPVANSQTRWDRA